MHSFFRNVFLYVCLCGSNACIANPSWIPGARLQTFFMGVVRAWGLSAKRLFDARLLVSAYCNWCVVFRWMQDFPDFCESSAYQSLYILRFMITNNPLYFQYWKCYMLLYFQKPIDHCIKFRKFYFCGVGCYQYLYGHICFCKCKLFPFFPRFVIVTYYLRVFNKCDNGSRRVFVRPVKIKMVD